MSKKRWSIYEYYMQKSKKEKKNSYLLAGTSIAILSAFYLANYHNGIDQDAQAFIIAACAFLAAAYALRVASIIHHKKALRLSANFIKSNGRLGNQTGLFTQSYPALTLKVPL